MLNELGVTRGQATRYVLMPQIFPRLKKLFGSGFANIPLFVLIVFNTLKIIPDSHPLMRRDQARRHSLIEVMAVAADNITFDRKNLDKITIFGVVLAGIVMIVLQLILCVLALIAAPAYAYTGPSLGPQTFTAYFSNNNPDTDIAFRVLDMVFGVKGLFTTNTEVTAFHQGFHALLEFYSYGILLVGFFVIIYLVMAIVMETAESGVPFGQRFNKAWAPVRLILFFALLLPTGNGINLAQYILLNAAKYGSNFATNGWILFDQTVRSPYIAKAEQLIAVPELGSQESLAGFMALARTCAWAEGRVYGRDIKSYFVFGAGKAGSIEFEGSAPPFVDLVARAAGGTISIRYGVQDEKEYPSELGGVFPNCGEITLTIVDQGQPGAAYMQQAFLGLIGCMWNGNSGGLGSCKVDDFDDMARDFTLAFTTIVPYKKPDLKPYVGSEKKRQILMQMDEQMNAALQEAIKRQRAQGSWARDPAQNLGWGGAGIWFNKIAEQNGAMTAAVNAKPEVKKLPYVMEFIREQKLREDSNVSNKVAFIPRLSSGKKINFEMPEDREISLVLNQVYQYWNLDDAVGRHADTTASEVEKLSGNLFVDVMNVFFGTKGLFDMCKNADVHPLAQLSAMGKGMVEKSIRTFAMALGTGVTGGIAAVLEKHGIKQALTAATSFFVTIASIGLMMGFLLYYVLPFIPFIYFFFAVMTWVKAIFEAMVGMPLWALAHLRIDGEGVAGEAAAQGYFYVFEIFLRPILIVISFLGALIIFSAMVKVLNSIFYLVIANLTGHDVSQQGESITGCFNPPGTTGPGSGGPGAWEQDQMSLARGVVDQFFYTVVYAIIVYMIATPCFKLVDDIPDNIMRWMGSGIQTFGAGDGDPAQGLMKYTAGGLAVLGRGGTSLGGLFKPFK